MKNNGLAYSELGAKIKALRIELGLTQNELSEGIVTRNMLSRIENSDVSPSLNTVTALASRLGVPVGYLIDDRDDGSKVKAERLINMVKSDMADGKYESALEYLSALDQFEDEKRYLTAVATYSLAVQGLYSEGTIKDTQKLFSDALKLSSYLDPSSVNEGRVYRALLDGFSYDSKSGNEEAVIKAVIDYAEMSCDVSLLSSALIVKDLHGCDMAKIFVENSVFSNKGFLDLALGVICLEKGDPMEAKAHLIKAMSVELPSVIRCYCLTILERTCAELKDFENAYCYMTMRKELIEKIVKK